MKGLREGVSHTATRSISDKLLREQERSHLQHLVSSSVPSPPQHYGGLTLLNPTALFGADPSAMFQAHLLASIAAANPNSRFQLPIPISLGVSAPGQMFHPTTTGGTASLPTAQLDMLSSWIKDHSASKDDRKVTTTKSSSNKTERSNKNGKKVNWTVRQMNNKRNKSDDLVSSENCINNLKRELESPLIIPTKDLSPQVPEHNSPSPPQTNLNNNNNIIINNNNNNDKGGVTLQARDKVFTCPICSRGFGYKHVLQNHERTHTGEKPFECSICGKKFTRDHHLKTHMRLHTGEKPYRCPHCDRKFVQVANLRRHLRVHTGERPYACDLCESRFSDSNQLKAHMLIHKGEKPYSCGACGGSYRRRHHMNSHKCSHKNNNNNSDKVSPGSSFIGSPQDVSPTASVKRERKPRETRRIIRTTTVTSSSSPHNGFVPPEQTHPEDLSLTGSSLRSRHFSGSHSSLSASPSPLSGGSHGSYCRSINSSDPPDYSSDDNDRRNLPDTTHGKGRHDDD